jgi:hypothetical protein
MRIERADLTAMLARNPVTDAQPQPIALTRACTAAPKLRYNNKFSNPHNINQTSPRSVYPYNRTRKRPALRLSSP